MRATCGYPSASTRLLPGPGPKKTMLVSTGAEAVENAIKIARAYTKRPAIIAFEDAFHGRTYMALALTSKTHPYKAGFEPFPSDVYRIPYAYCYRCSYSKTYPSCDVFCARHLEDTFKRVVAAESVAAVIVEPILGEGGFVIPPAGFYPALTEICRKHGILVIADEIQTGFARAGAMFASTRLGLEPDLVTMAKSLTGGLPLAAVTGRSAVMDAPGIGGLGGTFAGSPGCLRGGARRLGLDREGKSLQPRRPPRRDVPKTCQRLAGKMGSHWRGPRHGRHAGP